MPDRHLRYRPSNSNIALAQQELRRTTLDLPRTWAKNNGKRREECRRFPPDTIVVARDSATHCSPLNLQMRIWREYSERRLGVPGSDFSDYFNPPQLAMRPSITDPLEDLIVRDPVPGVVEDPPQAWEEPERHVGGQEDDDDAPPTPKKRRINDSRDDGVQAQCYVRKSLRDAYPQQPALDQQMEQCTTRKWCQL